MNKACILKLGYIHEIKDSLNEEWQEDTRYNTVK